MITPVLPTVIVDAFDVTTPPEAFVVPDPPDVTVDVDTRAAEVLAKDTL